MCYPDPPTLSVNKAGTYKGLGDQHVNAIENQKNNDQTAKCFIMTDVNAVVMKIAG